MHEDKMGEVEDTANENKRGIAKGGKEAGEESGRRSELTNGKTTTPTTAAGNGDLRVT